MERVDVRLDWWRKWERLNRGGTGLHNKPVGCGASESCAPGPDGEEEEEEVRKIKSLRGSVHNWRSSLTSEYKNSYPG